LDLHNMIPNSVTHLSFGRCFTKNITGHIPNSVTHLKFELFEKI